MKPPDLHEQCCCKCWHQWRHPPSAAAAVAAAASEPMTLTILFSNKRLWWHRFWTELKYVESLYPWLIPLLFEFEVDRSLTQPVFSSGCGIAGVEAVAAAAAAAFEGQYQRFEDYLRTTHDGVQVAIAHSRAAAEYAEAVRMELAGLDRGFHRHDWARRLRHCRVSAAFYLGCPWWWWLFAGPCPPCPMQGTCGATEASYPPHSARMLYPPPVPEQCLLEFKCPCVLLCRLVCVLGAQLGTGEVDGGPDLAYVFSHISVLDLCDYSYQEFIGWLEINMLSFCASLRYVVQSFDWWWPDKM